MSIPEAEELITQRLQNPEKLTKSDEKITYYNAHLTVAKEARNKVWEGAAYEDLGNTFYDLADFEKAIAYTTTYIWILPMTWETTFGKDAHVVMSWVTSKKSYIMKI